MPDQETLMISRKPDPPPKQPCGTCNGEGGWWEHGNGKPGTPPKRWIKCWDCNGLGKQ